MTEKAANKLLQPEQTDEEKGKTLLDAFIAWTNADHEDTLTLNRNQCCYMRDEIQRLRLIKSLTMQP